MAASTWCRFRYMINGIKKFPLQTFSRHCSSVSRTVPGEVNQAENAYPNYEISTEEFKHVERLLPAETVPPPPEHATYPTPSGWIPPKENQSTDYFVRRTKNHMLPVYLTLRNGGTRKVVTINKIEGDIWAFEADLRAHLEKIEGRRVATQVNEVGRFVRVKGLFQDFVAEWLIEKGF